MPMEKLLSLFACVLTAATGLKAQQPACSRLFVYDQRVPKPKSPILYTNLYD